MLTLRSPIASDEDLIFGWRNQPRIMEAGYNSRPVSSTEHHSWFSGLLNDADPVRKYWLICLDGQPIGVAGLYNIDTSQGTAFWMFYIGDAELRGMGTGPRIEAAILSYVFEERLFNLLRCDVLAWNEGVIAMHKRFGFEPEEEIEINGKRAVRLALSRSRWLEMKPDIMAGLVERYGDDLARIEE